MSLYPKRLRASLLMTGLLVLALTLEDVHAKWRFKFNIFGGGKTSSVPRLSTSHLTPVALPPSIPSFHLDTVGLSYRGRPHSQPSVPDLPIGWKPQVPLGGTYTNIYDRMPAYNPFFKSGATQSLSGEGGSFSSSRFDYGLGSHSQPSVPAWPIDWKIPRNHLATLPAHISSISSFGETRNNIYDRPPAYNPFFKSGATQSLSGEGDSFGSRSFVIRSHAQPLDPINERLLKSVATQAQRNTNLQRKSHPGEGGTSSSSDFDFDEIFTGIENTVRDISTDKNETVHYPEATQRSGLGLGTGLFPGALGHSLTPTHNREVELAEGKGGEDKNISIPTTSALGLDETESTTEETQEASTFWLPVASSAPARITRDIFRKSLPHRNDPSRMAEQIFGNVSIISVIITLLHF
nr:uncharacterized protein LOC108011876 [Drosophila suzukii]